MLDLARLLKVKSYRELDIGTHVSLKHSYIYFQISKSASSTVKYYLQSLEVQGTGRQVVDVNNRNYSPHIWPSQLTKEHFVSLLSSPSVKKVSFVRNPFSRLLSCYMHRIRMCPNSPSVKNIRKFTKNRFGPDLSFPDFINIVCDQSSRDQDPHWRVQSDEIFYEMIPEWAFIGKVENINEDLRTLIGMLGGQHVEPIHNASPAVTSASKNLSRYYCNSLQRKVAERFKRDFVNFQYDMHL